MMNKTGCLNLLCNTAVIWKTVHAEDARSAQQLRAASQRWRSDRCCSSTSCRNGIHDFEIAEQNVKAC